MNNLTNILDLPIGHSTDWKFGLITRDVYRMSETKFELTDTSHGWLNCRVDLDTMRKLINGEQSILDLNWK